MVLFLLGEVGLVCIGLQVWVIVYICFDFDFGVWLLNLRPHTWIWELCQSHVSGPRSFVYVFIFTSLYVFVCLFYFGTKSKLPVAAWSSH